MPKKQPLYMKVQEELVEVIHTLNVGDKIPPEYELEKMFGVSRVTVRKAVENLVSEGLLQKCQGVGTTVCETSTTQSLGKIYSWTEEMKRKNQRSTSSNQIIHRIKPSLKLKNELRMSDEEKIIMVSRIKLVNDIPIVIMVNYLREVFIPGFYERGLQRDSLYEELEQVYGINLFSGEEIIRARSATAYEAAALQIEEGAAILNVRRKTFLKYNRPFEIVDMVARGDKYQYFAKLGGRDKTKIIK